MFNSSHSLALLASKIVHFPAVVLMVTGLLFVPFLSPQVGAQDIQENLCRGANIDEDAVDCGSDFGIAEEQISELIATAIDLFSLVIGIIAVVMIMVGGVKYITSQGDSGNVTAAKNTILYAIIGLVVVALAQLIVRFVLGTTADIANS